MQLATRIQPLKVCSSATRGQNFLTGHSYRNNSERELFLCVSRLCVRQRSVCRNANSVAAALHALSLILHRAALLRRRLHARTKLPCVAEEMPQVEEEGASVEAVSVSVAAAGDLELGVPEEKGEAVARRETILQQTRRERQSVAKPPESRWTWEKQKNFVFLLIAKVLVITGNYLVAFLSEAVGSTHAITAYLVRSLGFYACLDVGCCDCAQVLYSIAEAISFWGLGFIYKLTDFQNFQV